MASANDDSPSTQLDQLLDHLDLLDDTAAETSIPVNGKVCMPSCQSSSKPRTESNFGCVLMVVFCFFVLIACSQTKFVEPTTSAFDGLAKTLRAQIKEGHGEIIVPLGVSGSFTAFLGVSSS
jgi:hypothetical protein